jgi:hypothetical protein
MTLIGYTMMCEQTGPKQLVRDVRPRLLQIPHRNMRP